jgi:DNA-binding response OmpR family regulator
MAKILVIDDEPHIRTLVKAFLVKEGHEVDLAENGMEGLKLIGLNPYDLLITDIVMPEKDGLELIMDLKGRVPRIRIIVISGGGTRLNIDNYLNLARLMGADRVLPKPLDFLKLQVAVKEVLEAQP